VELEAEARLAQLMRSAGMSADAKEAEEMLSGGGDGGDAVQSVEQLMARMTGLRDHGSGLDDATRRARAANLALEAARLCGFEEGDGDSSEDELRN